MGRQTSNSYREAISYQAQGSMRIDPHGLRKYFQSADIRAKAAELAGQPEEALFPSQKQGLVQIKGQCALVECWLSSGLPLLVRVPMSYYEGIGARFITGEREGNPLICLLELVHRDPSLTVPLFASCDLEEAAVDWKSWSNCYQLTMLLQPLGSKAYVKAEMNGDSLSGIITQEQTPRRPHSQFAARRPRFLTRRKVGQFADLPKVEGREIIARN